jgi:lipoate-protein ligase B
VLELGTEDYLRCWELQKELAEERWQEAIDDTLIIVEHPHTYTTGRAGKDANILFDDALLAKLGAKFYRTDRGGDITYHGPGQMVGYPILDLRRWSTDLHAYLRALEEVTIKTLADFGIASGRVAGATGVWVGNEKIAAIGVRVTRWVTLHGFALNIDPDLDYFRNIIPCGLHDRGVTSMAKLLNGRVELDAVRLRLLDHFSQEFGLQVIPGPQERELNHTLREQNGTL